MFFVFKIKKVLKMRSKDINIIGMVISLDVVVLEIKFR